MRRRMSFKKDRRVFKKTARKMHRLNYIKPMRGGVTL
ncbi:MAG: hypothetical protein [Arizlama microvirus]|nr:MAG: hypothetical protein [Arizlama microvirus]